MKERVEGGIANMMTGGEGGEAGALEWVKGGREEAAGDKWRDR